MYPSAEEMATNQRGVDKMSRYKTEEWRELVKIQNSMPHVDILTITGFMDDKDFIKHLETYKTLTNK